MSIYAQPQTVTKLADCLFYHAMDIPGFGSVEGAWDLRETVDAYLGDVDVAGKRVLEIGKASGFLTFHMEGLGATVVAHDLSSTDDWDAVPYARPKAPTTTADGEPDPCRDWQEWLEFRQWGIRVINNGFWLAYGAHTSQVKVVESSVYELPLAIGPVDITTLRIGTPKGLSIPPPTLDPNRSVPPRARRGRCSSRAGQVSNTVAGRAGHRILPCTAVQGSLRRRGERQAQNTSLTGDSQRRVPRLPGATACAAGGRAPSSGCPSLP